LSPIGRVIFGKNPRRTTIRIVVLAVVAFATFRWWLIPIRTEGISMQPTYESGRLNLVNRFAYASSTPSRGDVVAIRLAGPSVVYVKRVVGLPGEKVAIVDGTVRINGSPLNEPYVRYRRSWNLDEETLGPQEYFLIGDNRGMREGDHDFGRATIDRIVGKVVF
jgi:signal peptidase I